jgi:hypothetical protein
MNKLQLIDCYKEFYDWLMYGTDKKPIDIDLAWKLAGYKNKGIVAIILRRFYEADKDYFALGGAKYMLSFRCFQDLCIKAPSKIGKYIMDRLITDTMAAVNYIEDCEKQALKKEGLLPFPQMHNLQWVKGLLDGTFAEKADKYLLREKGEQV